MRSTTLRRLAAALMTASLGAGWVSAGNLDQLNYVFIPGDRVSTLFESPNNQTFPNNPWNIDPYIEIMNPNEPLPAPEFVRTKGSNPQNSATYVRGFIEPPQTGEYTFWVSGFSDAEFHLSSDTSPFNAVREAYTDGGTGENAWAQRLTQKSRPITLTKGQQYYFHIIQKSGGVGGAASVGWWLPDHTLQRPIPIRYAQRFAFAATCVPETGCSGDFLAERNVPTPIFDRNPGNNGSSNDSQLILTENQPLDLSPWITANYPVTFQWQQMVGYVPNNSAGTPSNLAGETTSTKYIERLTVADHHQKAYRIQATRLGNTATSTTVYLSVFQDTAPPTVVLANAAGNTNGFNVVFSEPVRPTTATNAANYSVPGLTVQRVEMLYGQTNSNTVVVFTSAPVPGNSVVTVQNVTDWSTANGNTGNVIAFNNTADILLTDGVITYFGYGAINGGDAIGGVDVQDLFNQTNRFPNNPDLRTTRPDMGIPNNVADNYGAQLIGFVIPPASGSYNFVIAADDYAVLWLGTDATAASKQAIAIEPEWNGFRAYTTADRRSDSVSGSPMFDRYFSGREVANDTSTTRANQSKLAFGNITLIRGNKYYIEAVMKEGGGGDNLDVTWQLPGQWTQNSDNGLVDGSAGIPGSFLSLFAAPGQSGPVTIVTQPADTATTENQFTTLSVVHGGSPSFSYQWYKNGIIIPDANDRVLSLPLPDPVTDNNATYSVRVRNLFSEATSSNATLTVTPDTTAPTVVRAIGSPNFNSVTIQFSEVVDPATAVNAANYSIVQTGTQTGLQILGNGTLSGAGNGGFTNVTFTTATQTEGRAYTVTVNPAALSASSVKDISNAGNRVAQGTTVPFTGWIVSRGFVLYQQYNNIVGGNVNTVKAQAKYPNSPDIQRYSTIWESGQNVADEFGARISGFFFAAGAGSYNFYMASDDNGELWIATDSSGSTLQQIAFEPAWGNRRSWTGTSDGRRTEGQNNTFGDNLNILNLAAGERRYMELIYKEGGGGDYGDATYSGPGQPAPANGTASTLVGARIGAYANPDETTFTFNPDVPSAITQGEGTTVFFDPNGSGRTMLEVNPAIFWQWQKKATNAGAAFVDIAGANARTYTTPALALEDNGAQWRLLATIPGRTTTSTVATVSVVQDLTSPTVTAVTGAPPAPGTSAQNRVLVYFSEPMQRTLAETPGNYSITAQGGGALAVSAASLSPNGRVATLTTAAQTPGTVYDITITGLTDPAQVPNTIAPNPTQRSFTAWTLSPGLVRRQLYFDIGGGSLNNLTNHARYPNSPNVDSYVPLFEEPPSNPNRENFGTRITGLLVPDETTDYYFAISGDDNQGFWLSTDADPANRRLIVAEPQWNGYREWRTTDRRIGANGFFPGVTTLPINISSNTVGAVALTQGVQYYAELLAKEGGGGDSTAVTWWKAGETIPAAGTPAISGSFFRSYVNPDNAILISQQPQSQQVNAGQNATFTVAAAPYDPAFGGPVTYQWRKDGVNIGGATGSSYTINNVQQANVGSYDVVLNAPATPTATSTAAALTIGGVVPPPSLTITKNGNNVVVSYPNAAAVGGHALQKSTALPGGFAADGSGAVNGANLEATVDVTAQGAAGQSYWRTRQP